MVRSLALVSTMLCAAAFVSAQAPVDRPDPAAGQPAVQQPASPAAQQPAPSADRPSASTAGKVTYSGCVKPGTAPGTFVLDSAELSPAAGAGGAVGTSGAMKTTLNLTTKPGTDLKAHTGHKIEVSGSIAPPKAAPADAGAASSSAKPAQEFNVDSIKMVAASCTP